MPLTTKTYQERKWDWLPALRCILEEKKVFPHHYGPTTASDNMFDSLGRLMEIASLLREHKSQIAERAEEIGKEQILKDLERLEDALHGACAFFNKNLEVVRDLSHQLTHPKRS